MLRPGATRVDGHNREVSRDQSKVQGPIIARHTECAAAWAQGRVVLAGSVSRFCCR
jgi:hypothetical protein